MHKKILILIATVMLLSGCSYASQDLVFDEVPQQVDSSAAFLSLSDDDTGDSNVHTEEQVRRGIFVYVCGAVSEPGVYELDEGSRVIDAVKAAGGLSDTADETYVNLAAPLEDGLKLRIPTVEEISGEQSDLVASRSGSVSQGQNAQFEVMTKAIEGDGNSSDNGSTLVNINTATAEQLKTLPGIGDGIASRIVDYRTECGKFSCIEDIMKISGIKDKLFQKIKDRITV